MRITRDLTRAAATLLSPNALRSGAEAVDYNAIAKQESLSGLEVEMRKLEGVVKEIVDQLNYLKVREARMRDTNGECLTLELYRREASRTDLHSKESTNDRVRIFFILTLSTLLLLGAWQIAYLRSYFKSSPYSAQACFLN